MSGSFICYSLLVSFTGEFVAQFKFTVLLMPNGPLRITQGPTDMEAYESDKKIEDKEMKVCMFVSLYLYLCMFLCLLQFVSNCSLERFYFLQDCFQMV